MSRHGDADLRAGKAPSQRQLRVGEELRHALADILRRADFRDPDLHDLNVTVSEVRISPDLKNATAFVMPLGGGHPEQIKALNRVSAYLRSQVAKAMRLQHVPRLSFQVDVSFDYAQRIDQLLHRPDVQRDLDHEHGNHGPDAEDGDEDMDGAEDGGQEGDAQEGTERHDGP